MAVSSYGNGVKSSGVVRILRTCLPDRGPQRGHRRGRPGLRPHAHLPAENAEGAQPEVHRGRHAAAQETRAQAKIDCAYVGFECPDEFIVGYGLDYAERYRNLPYIGVLKPELYN